MKVFKMDAHIEFRAENIDDALLSLAKHFLDVALDDDSTLEQIGEIIIEPVKEVEDDA